MMWFRNRPSPSAICALAALVGGLVAGATTTHGLRPNQYGPTTPTTLFHRSAYDVGADAGGYAESADEGYSDAAGCSECSERDLGYRWATLQAIRSAAQCPNDSWGFRRGCLDFTGGV